MVLNAIRYFLMRSVWKERNHWTFEGEETLVVKFSSCFLCLSG